jgi:predicted ATPase
MLKKAKIEGYRSIRAMHLNLDTINIITGPNGCGKSNLYKSIYLISKTVTGELAKTIAQEGGMASALWAGARVAKKPVRLSIEIIMGEYIYNLVLGLPYAPKSAFILDPVVKKETIKFVEKARKIPILERGNDNVFMRDKDGETVQYFGHLIPSESVLSQIVDPQKYPLLTAFSENLKKWRFYHQFRTDPNSPIRLPQIGYFSPILDHDGINLAATLQTLFEIGQGDIIRQFFSLAFPNNAIEIENDRGLFEVQMFVQGIKRTLSARELSDGTLRYMCLLALLLNPNPPALIAINEPEMSLNNDLLIPLAEMIIFASQNTQLWITTHSKVLADYIEGKSGIKTILLRQRDGQTELDGFD